jgi:nitrogen fixation NifU-like protein
LYREVILDHYRRPRHEGRLEHPDAHAEGENPLCGDTVAIDLTIDVDDRIVDVAVKGQGCSISQASASMMTVAIKGKTIDEIGEIAGKFRLMMGIDDGEDPTAEGPPGSVLGDLEALQGVRKFPVRIKCAALPWTTLEEALASLDD